MGAVLTGIHGQFTGIHVHKRERIGESLPSSRPIPQGERKERNHGRLGFFRK